MGPVWLPGGVVIPFGYHKTGAEPCQFPWERVWGKLVPWLTSLWDAKRVLVRHGASCMCVYTFKFKIMNIKFIMVTFQVLKAVGG